MTGKLQKGYVETVSNNEIAGWAFDAAASDGPAVIEIRDDDKLIAIRLADEFRPDLFDVGLPPKCGFSLRFDPIIFPRSRHTISVRFQSSGVELEGSPAYLTNPNAKFDTAAQTQYSALIQSSVQEASTSEELSFILAPILSSVGQVVQRYRALAPGAPLDLGRHSNNLSPEVRGWLENTLKSYPQIELPIHDRPDVSIVIPVFNKFDWTYRCVQSILTMLPRASIEVIIVDDLSFDETILGSLIFLGGVRTIRNPENLGFVHSCNNGARNARGRYLFFLNNDTEVKAGFLDSLLSTFANVPNVGIAGSKLIFPDGKLQECGGIIWRLGDGWNWGRGHDPEHFKFCYLRDADYVSGAALMLERELFDKVGGFDAHYAPAYYEDTDLCFRVRQQGFRVVVQPASVIVHHEGVSSGTSTASGMKRYQVVNHSKFRDRWASVLAQHRFNGDRPELECERAVTRRALFIDDSVPTPDKDAGSNAAFEHMRSLQRLGYKVTFLPADNLARIDPYTSALQQVGIECVYHPYISSVEAYFKSVVALFDLVYFHRYSNASKYAGMCRQSFPNATLLYNVADLHFLRMQREAQVTKSGDTARRASDMQRLELAAMKLVDSIIVHSGHESEILVDALDSGDVFVIPWVVRNVSFNKEPELRSGVGFLGGYRHRPNIDAAVWLANKIMPIVNSLNPSIVCKLAGSEMPDMLASLKYPNVEMVGWVESASTFFGDLRLSIAPLRYGAGIKGKILDSFAAGTPCVMTAIAAEGLNLPPELTELVADSAEEIAALIHKIYPNLERLKRLSLLCRTYIQQYYSEAAVDRLLAMAAAVRANGDRSHQQGLHRATIAKT